MPLCPLSMSASFMIGQCCFGADDTCTDSPSSCCGVMECGPSGTCCVGGGNLTAAAAASDDGQGKGVVESWVKVTSSEKHSLVAVKVKVSVHPAIKFHQDELQL